MSRKAETPNREPALRIDKLLWYLRFARNRVMAKRLAEKGHLRLNGRRVERAHQMVRRGDILTVPQGRTVHVVRVSMLPQRRGNAKAAESCFELLSTAN